MARKNFTFFLDKEIIKTGKRIVDINTLDFRSFNQYVEQAIQEKNKKSSKLGK